VPFWRDFPEEDMFRRRGQVIWVYPIGKTDREFAMRSARTANRKSGPADGRAPAATQSDLCVWTPTSTG
jgi:hypothetical protein